MPVWNYDFKSEFAVGTLEISAFYNMRFNQHRHVNSRCTGCGCLTTRAALESIELVEVVNAREMTDVILNRDLEREIKYRIIDGMRAGTKCERCANKTTDN